MLYLFRYNCLTEPCCCCKCCCVLTCGAHLHPHLNEVDVGTLLTAAVQVPSDDKHKNQLTATSVIHVAAPTSFL